MDKGQSSRSALQPNTVVDAFVPPNSGLDMLRILRSKLNLI